MRVGAADELPRVLARLGRRSTSRGGGVHHGPRSIRRGAFTPEGVASPGPDVACEYNFVRHLDHLRSHAKVLCGGWAGPNVLISSYGGGRGQSSWRPTWRTSPGARGNSRAVAVGLPWAINPRSGGFTPVVKRFGPLRLTDDFLAVFLRDRPGERASSRDPAPYGRSAAGGEGRNTRS